jgi:hypothetical protein
MSKKPKKNPEEQTELTDEELEGVSGGRTPTPSTKNLISPGVQSSREQGVVFYEKKGANPIAPILPNVPKTPSGTEH